MPIFHSALLYIHFPTLGKILYLNLFKHPSLRRWLWTLLFLALQVMMWTLIFVGRVLDELLLWPYHFVKLEKPLFVISNPRSGTTFLHRLLEKDTDRFQNILLYHTIVPAASWILLIRFIGLIEWPLGSPLRRLFNGLDGLLFGGWADIHPMGFNQSEEDEALFVLTTFTPGVFLLTPFVAAFPEFIIPDRSLPPRVQQHMMTFYKSSIKRIVFAAGGAKKTFLSKNVQTTGRFRAFMKTFPDARVVYIVRTPYKSVPSYISMFSSSWPVVSPDVKPPSVHHTGLGEIVLGFYRYFNEVRDDLPPERFMLVRYDDLIANPRQVIEEIYAKFGWEIRPKYAAKLQQQNKRQKKYKSKHSYSLEQYGYTPGDILNAVPEVFERLDFEKDFTLATRPPVAQTPAVAPAATATNT